MSVNAWQEEIVGVQPAAGANFVRRVPGETFEHYRAVRFQLTTDATVANREVYLDFQDGDGTSVVRLASAAVQAASLTYDYSFTIDFDVAAASSGTIVNGPLPNVRLQSGWSLVISALALDASDQFKNIRLYANRIPTGPMWPATGAEPFDPAEWGV